MADMLRLRATRPCLVADIVSPLEAASLAYRHIDKRRPSNRCLVYLSGVDDGWYGAQQGIPGATEYTQYCHDDGQRQVVVLCGLHYSSGIYCRWLRHYHNTG